MHHKKHSLLIVLLLLSLFLEACVPTAPVEEPTPEVPPTEAPVQEPVEETESEPMIFTDDLGATLEFMEYPQSIVSISSSTTEILFAIGAGGQVVGRDDFSLFPEEALEVTSVGSLWGELPTEAILALEPDLVVAAQTISSDQIQALRDLGLNVYWQANPTTYDDLWDNLRDFAVITGHEEEAEALIADLAARVKAVEEKIAPLSYRPSVFYELDATEPSAPWTSGSGTFIDYIITTAGGFNVAAEVEGDYIQFSAEELISANPEIILLGDSLYGVTPEMVAERPGWDAVAAVTNNAIYPIDPNIMSVPGPRLVDALEETARIFHPDVFE